MKFSTPLLLCIGLQLFGSHPALARSGTGKPPIPDGSGGEPINLVAAEKDPNVLRGTCTLVEGPTDSFSSPCVDLVIVLTDEKGAEISRTRTTSKGAFKFTADKKKVYLLGAGSDLYELISPTGSFHGGTTVELKFREK